MRLPCIRLRLLFLQLNEYAAFLDMDSLHPGGKGIPEALVTPQFIYQIDIFDAAEPGVGQGDPPKKGKSGSSGVNSLALNVISLRTVVNPKKYFKIS